MAVGFPTVPAGKARIRVMNSAAHSKDDLEVGLARSRTSVENSGRPTGDGDQRRETNVFCLVCVGIRFRSSVVYRPSSSVSSFHHTGVPPMRKHAIFITGASGEVGHALIRHLGADGDNRLLTLDLKACPPDIAPLSLTLCPGGHAGHQLVGPAGERIRDRHHLPPGRDRSAPGPNSA